MRRPSSSCAAIWGQLPDFAKSRSMATTPPALHLSKHEAAGVRDGRSMELHQLMVDRDGRWSNLATATKRKIWKSIEACCKSAGLRS